MANLRGKILNISILADILIVAKFILDSHCHLLDLLTKESLVVLAKVNYRIAMNVY